MASTAAATIARTGRQQPGQHPLSCRHPQRRLDALVAGPPGVVPSERLPDRHEPGERHAGGEHELAGDQDPRRRRVRRLLGRRRRQLHGHELLGAGRRRDDGEHGVDLGLQRRHGRRAAGEAQEHRVAHGHVVAVALEERRPGDDRALPGPGQPGDAADHRSRWSDRRDRRTRCRTGRPRRQVRKSSVIGRPAAGRSRRRRPRRRGPPPARRPPAVGRPRRRA